MLFTYIFVRILARSFDVGDETPENFGLILGWWQMSCYTLVKEILVETVLNIRVDKEHTRRIVQLVDLLHVLAVKLDHDRVSTRASNVVRRVLAWL
jgi:hypothetical protein